MKKADVKSFWSKYNIYLLILLGIILVVLVVKPNISSRQEAAEVVLRSSVAPVRTQEQTKESGTFKKNDSFQISSLIRYYYDALMGRENVIITKYVDDVDSINSATRMLYSQYVMNVTDLEIYVVDGLVDNTYVLAVTGYMYIKDVNSKVPFLDKFYVLSNKNGDLYITTMELSDNVNTYNELMYESEQIKKLNDRVALEYDQVLDKEPKLRQIMEKLR